MKQVMEKFAADKDLIPNLLASLDVDRILSMVEAVPPQLLLQVVNSVDMDMVMGLVQRFMPMVSGSGWGGGGRGACVWVGGVHVCGCVVRVCVWCMCVY